MIKNAPKPAKLQCIDIDPIMVKLWIWKIQTNSDLEALEMFMVRVFIEKISIITYESSVDTLFLVVPGTKKMQHLSLLKLTQKLINITEVDSVKISLNSQINLIRKVLGFYFRGHFVDNKLNIKVWYSWNNTEIIFSAFSASNAHFSTKIQIFSIESLFGTKSTGKHWPVPNQNFNKH